MKTWDGKCEIRNVKNRDGEHVGLRYKMEVGEHENAVEDPCLCLYNRLFLRESNARWKSTYKVYFHFAQNHELELPCSEIEDDAPINLEIIRCFLIQQVCCSEIPKINTKSCLRSPTKLRANPKHDDRTGVWKTRCIKPC